MSKFKNKLKSETSSFVRLDHQTSAASFSYSSFFGFYLKQQWKQVSHLNCRDERTESSLNQKTSASSDSRRTVPQTPQSKTFFYCGADLWSYSKHFSSRDNEMFHWSTSILNRKTVKYVVFMRKDIEITVFWPRDEMILILLSWDKEMFPWRSQTRR